MTPTIANYFEFEEDSEDDDLFSEAIVGEDFHLEEVQDEKLLENTAQENLGIISNCDSDQEFEIPLSFSAKS